MAKLNKSSSTSAKLKASGASSSRTDRTGKQTFYESGKGGDLGKAIGTSTQKNPAVIPMNAMNNVPVADVPTMTAPTDTGLPQLIGDNVQNNQYVFDPKESDAENAVAEKSANNMSALNIVQKFIGVPESKEPILAQIEKDAKLKQKEQAVNNYQSELNSIVASSQAEQLKLEGQGRGQTSGFIGGEQARINREAAIQALPVQAQLSAAQGNLALAEKQVERLFALKSEDLDRQYNYRTAMGNMALSIANESQKDILNVKLSEIQEKKDAEKQTLEFERQKTLKNLSGGGIGVGGTNSYGGSGQFANDLDAMIGTVLSTIPSKFGQQTFNTQMSKARNDADKLNILAGQVLQGQPAEFKNDFRNQAVGISQLDKAIALLDEGVQTGVLQNAAQYTYNLAGKDFDPKIAQINNLITSAIQPYRNSVTGAAWGEQEDGEYQQLFGSAKYSPTELRQRLEQTKELLKSKSSEGLNTFVNPTSAYENPFNTAFNVGGLGASSPVAPQKTDAPATRGFWGTIGNFLWGND